MKKLAIVLCAVGIIVSVGACSPCRKKTEITVNSYDNTITIDGKNNGKIRIKFE